MFKITFAKNSKKFRKLKVRFFYHVKYTTNALKGVCAQKSSVLNHFTFFCENVEFVFWSFKPICMDKTD